MDGQTSKPKKNRSMNFRSQHRARSHESAHANASAQAPVVDDVAERPLVHRGPADVIETDEQLKQLISDLRQDGTFAYDSEFIGELTYHPRLCLLQTASHRRVALIDPLAEIDLIPFWELLADPSVEKIVHAGEQDIEPVVRHLKKPAANVLDTQICAGFVGLPYPLSLSKLVAEMTGAKLGKGLTFTHWDNRPLSPVQLKYAADDVRYLPAAAAELVRRLDALGHTAWAREECEAVCSPDLYKFDPQTQYMRVRGASSLQPRNMAILRELTNLRDAAAREQDVPPRTFMKDEVLLDLARNPAKSIDHLSKVRGLPRPVESEYGQQIIDATSKAFTLPAIDLPAPREYEPSPKERFRADAVFCAAQCLSAGMALDPALVASRQDVSDFYRWLNAGNLDAEKPKLMQGWRKEAVGGPLTEFLQGKRKFELNWAEGSLRATS